MLALSAIMLVTSPLHGQDPSAESKSLEAGAKNAIE
jgi:hypothetical protein